MSLWEKTLELLGWIGIVLGLLTIAVVVAAVAVAMLLDWGFGVPLLMVSILVISIGITGSYYTYRVFAFEKEALGFASGRFVKCPYCNMRNPVDSSFCVKCGKALPELRPMALDSGERETY